MKSIRVVAAIIKDKDKIWQLKEVMGSLKVVGIPRWKDRRRRR